MKGARWTGADLAKMQAAKTLADKAAQNPRLTRKPTANSLTRFVLAFLESQGVEAWRDNTTGVFDSYKAADFFFKWFNQGQRPSLKQIKQALSSFFRKSHEKKGKSDIAGYHRKLRGVAVFVEIKIGNDKLSPEQIHFLSQAKRSGCIALVARSEDQFINDWNEVMKSFS